MEKIVPICHMLVVADFIRVDNKDNFRVDGNLIIHSKLQILYCIFRYFDLIAKTDNKLN